MKVLVVEDNMINRIILQEILSGYGEVHSCVDGTEAVLAFRRSLEQASPYDLVCMDVVMPVMGGIEALKLIRREEKLHGRSRPRATKVVMTTGSDDKNTIDSAFNELCDAYIVKPIDAKELRDIVLCLFPLDERSM
jgi:two-component system chemotaxis response regulator CheY